MARFTSILFPRGGAAETVDVAPDCFGDLHLDGIIAAVNAGDPADRVDEFFYAPLHDVAGVEHRHEVFRDLESDEIRQPIVNLVDGMRTMRTRLDEADQLRHKLQRQGWFLYAVQMFCDTMTSLRNDLARVEPASAGLGDFARYVAEYVDSAAFTNLARDTEAVRAELQKIRYTVHIQGSRVSVEKYSGQADYSQGVAAAFGRFTTEVSADYHVALKDRADMNHVETQILQCVAGLYSEAFALLAKFCRRNQSFVEPTIVRFDREIRFYLHYLAFVRRFTAAGLHFSYPEVTIESGQLSAYGACDLALAINLEGEQQPLVSNDFWLSGPEKIFVVTGPNQGGKTTFARTVGQCAYLASLGCPIPARSARFTLPDRIYTHFERQETLATLQGKLEDELVRIHCVLSRATASSIIVMNESFSSTTAADATLIGAQIIGRIVELGCVAVYVTFLDSLATADQACVSLVGDVASDDRRMFTFNRRPADGLAYAAALAVKYGLDYDVLARRISS